MPIRLDQRLAKIATLIKCDCVADIGCDHGKLSYYLVSTDRAKRAIATDISAPSLKKAAQLASENGVSHLIQTRLGDGLAPIADGEADTVVIAGLGGDVISGVLARASEQGKHFDSFVLSPNTHPEKVRVQLAKMGHTIVFDGLVECANKYYTVIATKIGEADKLDENQVLYGKFYKSDSVFLKKAREEVCELDKLICNHQSDALVQKREKLAAVMEQCEQSSKE